MLDWMRSLFAQPVPTTTGLIAEWVAFEEKATREERRNVTNPRLIAGQYLEWAGRHGIDWAINALSAHASGQYIDMPPFSGCREALTLLERIRESDPSSCSPAVNT